MFTVLDYKTFITAWVCPEKSGKQGSGDCRGFKDKHYLWPSGKRSTGCETTQDDFGNSMLCQPSACGFVDKSQLANEHYLQPVPSTG